jgi:hypothetical protein
MVVLAVVLSEWKAGRASGQRTPPEAQRLEKGE